MTKQAALGVTVGVIAAAIAFGLGFLAGGSSVTIVDAVLPERAPTGSARFHVKVNQVRQDGALDVQIVEWAGGDEAERAALEDKACSLRAIEDDECTPNGFYMRTSNTSLTLTFASEARIILYDFIGPEGPVFRELTFDDLIASSQAKFDVETRPLIVTTQHGAITRMEEQYVP